MSKYRKKPVVIEATQWFKNGDHPEDKRTELMAMGESHAIFLKLPTRRPNDAHECPECGVEHCQYACNCKIKEKRKP